MAHQIAALKADGGREAFALLMEQGTGKTWVVLAVTERLYAAGNVDGLFVLAPNGVHTNWTRREIPTHMDVPVEMVAWRAGVGARQLRAWEATLFRKREHGESPPLRVLTMSYDAINTKAGLDFARRFLNATRAIMVLDESVRIKNPAAARTKRVMSLRHLAQYRRIMNGTPIGNGPMDAFAQFEFLDEGLLGTTSYRAFVAEHSVLMSMDTPQMKALVQRNPRIAHAQIVAKDEVTGAPLWRNLDKLQARIARHSFRILKKDCLDLPEKVYREHTFALDPTAQAAYDLMRDEFRLLLGDGTVAPVQKLAALMKAQQITSGFVFPPPDPKNPDAPREPIMVGEPERLRALMDLLEDIPGQFIVWARFREEIAQIERAFRDAGISSASYHGGVTKDAREEAVDSFQGGKVRAFIGQPQSGGIGLTLNAANTVIYYSNDFSYLTRSQSEDRAHRIGTRKSVLYIDMIAEGTLDEQIVGTLLRKQDVAAIILGDGPSSFRGII